MEEHIKIANNGFQTHDGSGGPADGIGHRHDWEDAIVVWKRTQENVDWWQRGVRPHSSLPIQMSLTLYLIQGVLLSQHGNREFRTYDHVQTVNGPGDVDDTDGKNRLHPKFYAGFWKHANFFEKKTSYMAIIPNHNEFRSNEYYFLPGADNMLLQSYTLV
jgi:hypothetical protein